MKLQLRARGTYEADVVGRLSDVTRKPPVRTKDEMQMQKNSNQKRARITIQ